MRWRRTQYGADRQIRLPTDPRSPVVRGGKSDCKKSLPESLQGELEAVISEAKKMARKIEQPSELWDLEAYLTRRRNEIDNKYDYRHSVLPCVFAELIREGRLKEQDLRGLGRRQVGICPPGVRG
jgi:hypothetical protein